MTKDEDQPKPAMLTPTMRKQQERRERRAYGGYTLEEALEWRENFYKSLEAD